MFERKNIKIEMKSSDEKLLKENTVDFVFFSYYASRLTSADPKANKGTEGNVFATLKIDSVYLGFMLRNHYSLKDKYSTYLKLLI